MVLANVYVEICPAMIFHSLICHGNSLMEFMERNYFIMDHQENVTFGIAEFFRTGHVIEVIKS